MVTPIILIAEDDADVQSLLRHVLESDGYTVHVAADGSEALRMYDEVSPDLVVLDVMMPRMSGFEVLRELRADPDRRQDVPVLMLTARTGEDDVLEGFELGVSDFLTKPFVIGELRARVRALLTRRS
jgi:DNA-binding response OmpR family regulator